MKRTFILSSEGQTDTSGNLSLEISLRDNESVACINFVSCKAEGGAFTSCQVGVKRGNSIFWLADIGGINDGGIGLFRGDVFITPKSSVVITATAASAGFNLLTSIYGYYVLRDDND
jgi:hypothetical protein